jgi:hypothetical protein
VYCSVLQCAVCAAPSKQIVTQQMIRTRCIFNCFVHLSLPCAALCCVLWFAARSTLHMCLLGTPAMSVCSFGNMLHSVRVLAYGYLLQCCAVELCYLPALYCCAAVCCVLCSLTRATQHILQTLPLQLPCILISMLINGLPAVAPGRCCCTTHVLACTAAMPRC